MNFVDALMGKPVEKEFLFGGKKIVLKTLSQEEMNEVTSNVARMDFSFVELRKIPVLARSLVSIDGISVLAFAEVRDALAKDKTCNTTKVIEDLLVKMDTTLVHILYNFYTELEDAVIKEKEQLKNV